jgi:hypothetical protein
MKLIRQLMKQSTRSVLFSSVMIPFLLGLFLFKLKPPKEASELPIQPASYLEVSAESEMSMEDVIKLGMTAAAKCDVDTIPPVIYCPHTVTVECGDVLDPMINPDLGMGMGADNCDANPLITFEDDSPFDFCTGGVVLRTWTVTDSSGNSASCVQKVLIDPDKTPPTIEFIPQVLQVYPDGIIEVSCDATPDFSGMRNWVNAADNCTDDPRVLFREEALPGEGCLEGMPDTIRCIWTAVDDCGNRSQEISLLMVMIDDEAPEIVCPPDTVIACGQSIDPALLGLATATDNCDPTVDITYEDSGEVDFCEGGTIERTWKATDGCGNVDSCVQVITILPDIVRPTIAFKPEIAAQFPNGIVIKDCTDSLPSISEMAGWVNAIDNCDEEPSIEVIETTENADCLEDGYFRLITCKWVAIDRCGNASDTLVLEVQVIDTIPPVIECPENITADCNTDLNPLTNPEMGVATATDLCDSDPVITYTDSGFPDYCGGSTITRTWFATDACGNVDSCVQTITILPDTIAPEIEVCPSDLAFSCNPETVPGPDPGSVLAFDNCGRRGVEFEGKIYVLSTQFYSDWNDLRTEALARGGDIVAINSQAENDFLVRTFGGTEPYWIGFTDEVDEGDFKWSNGDPVTYTNWEPRFNEPNDNGGIEDHTVINWRGPGFWNDFNQGDPSFREGGYRGIIEISSLISVTVDTIQNDTMGCEGIVVYEYTVSDICGNTTSCRQTITYRVDEELPVFVNCPEPVDLGCNPDLAILDSLLSQPEVTDNCGLLSVEFEDIETKDGCTTTIERIWTATDSCFNRATCSQIVSYTIDTLPPLILDQPKDMVLGCNPEVIPEAMEPRVVDNCEDPTVTFSADTTLVGCTTTITRRWTAEDACGNLSDTVTQTISYTIDTLAPVIVNSPVDTFLGCNPTEIPEAPVVVAEDDCGVMEVFMTSNFDIDGCFRTITRTWIAIDSCGNESEPAVQRVTYTYDKTPPMVVCPADLDLGCNPDTLPLPMLADIQVTDNCGDESITLVVDTVKNDTVGCIGILQYRYTATDVCGNSQEAVHTITYKVDNEAPVLSECPEDLYLGCNPDEIPEPPTLTAHDNCEVAEIIFTESPIDSNGCLRTITRTWVAVDSCGNQSEVCEQKIYYTENDTAPVITCPEDMMLDECNPESIPPPMIDSVAVATSCNGEVMEYNGKYYMLTSASGNWPLINAEALAVGGNLVAINDQAEQDFLLATFGSTERLWIGLNDVDIEGTFGWTNGDPLTYTNWNPGEPNDLAPGEDFVLMNWGVNGAWNDFGPGRPDFPEGGYRGIIEMDIPPYTVSAEIFSHDTVGCEAVLVYEYTVTDICGNSDTCRQTITYKVDEEPPVIAECPADIDLGCNPETIPDFVPPVVTDNCGIMSLDSTVVNSNDGCNYESVVTWVATDSCGNRSIECVQRITWTVDTIAPVIECPEDLFLGCNPDSIPPMVKPIVTDNCSDVTINGSQRTSTDGCTKIIERTWIATDACGNSDTCVQIITYTVDTIAPVFVNCPEPVDLGCNPDVALTDFDGSRYVLTESSGTWEEMQALAESLGGNLVAVNSQAEQDYLTARFGADGVLWLGGTDRDSEGNFVWSNGDPFVYDNWNPGEPNNEPPQEDYLTFNSGFPGGWNDFGPQRPGYPANGYRGIVEIPVNFDDIFTQPDVVDNCGLMSLTSADTTFTEGCQVTVERTWTAVDNCNNVSTCTQVITYTVDTVAPQIDTLTTSLTVQCNYNDPDWNPMNINLDSILIVTDSCSSVNISVVDTLVAVGNCIPGDENNEVFLEKWLCIVTATDECGNSSEFIFEVNVVDTIPPEIFLPEPDTIMASCDSIPMAPTVTATDGCSVQISYFEEIEDRECIGEYDIIRTWFATDACGNESSVTQVVMVKDTVAPTIKVKGRLENLASGDSLRINCDEVDLYLNGNWVSAMDNCDPSPTLISNRFDNNAGGCVNGASRTIDLSWTATDDCGNRSEFNVTLVVVDNTPPTILGVPADTCATSLPPVPLVKAVDDCSNVGLSVGMSQTGPIICDGGTYYIRTWTATDLCGNVSTVSQQISIGDVSAPAIKILNAGFEGAVSGDTITINADCDRELGLPELKVFTIDGCSDLVSYTIDTIDLQGQSATTFSLVNIIITAEDLCGNQSTLDLIVRTIPTFVRARGIFRIPVISCLTFITEVRPRVRAQLTPSQQVNLNLEVETGKPTYGYIIERSADGEHFEPLDGVEFGDLFGNEVLDEAPLEGDNYYRVVHVYKDNTFAYSDVAKVEVPAQTYEILMYPNPTSERVSIDFGELSGQGGVLQVISPFGQLMRETNFEVFPDDALLLELNDYASGVYKVIITTDGGERSVRSLVVQKF